MVKITVYNIGSRYTSQCQEECKNNLQHLLNYKFIKLGMNWPDSDRDLVLCVLSGVNRTIRQLATCATTHSLGKCCSFGLDVLLREGGWVCTHDCETVVKI